MALSKVLAVFAGTDAAKLCASFLSGSSLPKQGAMLAAGLSARVLARQIRAHPVLAAIDPTESDDPVSALLSSLPFFSSLSKNRNSPWWRFAAIFATLILTSMATPLLSNAEGNIKVCVQGAWKWVLKLMQRNTYTRTIEFQQRHNKYGYRIHEADSDDRNQILQKAVTLFIASKEKDLDMWQGDIALSKPIAKAKKSSSYDSSDDEDTGEAAEQLKKYKVMTVPPKGQWVDIGNQLWFWEERNVSLRIRQNKRSLVRSSFVPLADTARCSSCRSSRWPRRAGIARARPQ
jgi:hypothetical protein